MTKRGIGWLACAVLLLTGCSTSVNLPDLIADKKPAIELQQLYLRGVFNWWEADPEYQLTSTQSGHYAVTIELIADGQPYDFKLSDANWTPANTCGGRYYVVEADLGVNTPLDCGDNIENVRFTPQTTGFYRFVVSQPRNGSLSLLITRQ